MSNEQKGSNFIREIVAEDVAKGRHGGEVRTRFPPEPNGYLHIGHAKAICLNFGIAQEFNGQCNLRFDDTNPTTEDVEYVESIKEDIRWLGFDWGDREYYASDYFEQLYQFAEYLIKKGKAYVDSLTEEEIREYRGDFYHKGKPSPYRDRSVEENLDLFRRMRAGEFPDGAHVLRAKIDLSSQNMNMRDPILYRIKHATHHRTKDKWCIYPMYDFAHPLSDAIERITHSICTLEFEDHRPLYDWVIEETGAYPSKQYEFARLNITYTVLSKRKLLELVEGGYVDGWDDPRMPTLSGMRRRGFSPEGIKAFIELIGVSKAESTVDIELLEHAVREDLNKRAQRVMAVLSPVKLVIDNFPEDHVEWFDAINNPEDLSKGTRKVPFSKELWVEADDYREEPPKGWFRLAPNAEVRLRYACIVRCKGAIYDENGKIKEIHCEWYPDTRGGNTPDGKVVKGTIHWVSARHCHDGEVRLYERLFSVPDPMSQEGDWKSFINPNSLKILKNCKMEQSLLHARPLEYFQFERLGYFCKDPKYSTPQTPIFNRTLPLKDSWAKIERKK